VFGLGIAAAAAEDGANGVARHLLGRDAVLFDLGHLADFLGERHLPYEGGDAGGDRRGLIDGRCDGRLHVRSYR
jgi:hypothetical protein